MTIAILGWGSLIWKPENLQYKSDWVPEGPMLPLEFSRITDERPLTVVLDSQHGVVCSTRFAWSKKTNLQDAIEDLRQRERAAESHIGYVDLQQNKSSLQKYPEQIQVDETIRQWCRDRQISAAIWTAIPPNFKDLLGVEFSIETAMNYLKGLSKPSLNRVLEYVRNTPEEVHTPLRKSISEEWLL